MDVNANADMLEREMTWFIQILESRVRLHFGQESAVADIGDLPPPRIEGDDSMYGRLVRHYDMTPAERLVFMLGLIPHLRPQLLDVFFTQNAAYNRLFTEFGARNGYAYGGFLPTGQTALFLLAGDDLARRLAVHPLFDADHFFAAHDILTLAPIAPNEPRLSGFLSLNPEVIDLVTTGKVRKPDFGPEFPARRIDTRMTWDDLVLDPDTREQIMEIHAWLEHGPALLGDLGLGRTLKPGFRSLFWGPPGTGKTLTASLLGRSTGRDVYCVDLAAVVSKYIGETEKNLERVFKKAAHKDWILFFDEADALFGKRTAVSDAHDRYANQEVSYLLQRVEDYPGVVILASNLKTNLDAAFTRRFQSVIHFPMPDAKDRLRLWRKGFSDGTPLSPEIDLDEIAGSHELSGGAVMNVVRHATLMALRRGDRIIASPDLREGIRREFMKEGRTLGG